jgi:hypothetical protein
MDGARRVYERVSAIALSLIADSRLIVATCSGAPAITRL